jgi:hypothetical protein
MRRVLSVVLFLIAGVMLLPGIAFSQSQTLRPLPVVMRGLPQTVVAVATDQADLQRAGYVLVESGGGPKPADRRERSYAFHGASGSSAVLVDNEYPPLAAIRRELVFDITFTANGGRSESDTAGIAPKLIAEMRTAVSQDPALVAGLGYLATAAASGVTPAVLQSAVIDYLQRYQQPSTPMHEACESCGSQDGFGDEYVSGPDMNTALNVGGPDWRIAAIRHSLAGDSTFRVEVTATIPRSSL